MSPWLVFDFLKGDALKVEAGFLLKIYGNYVCLDVVGFGLAGTNHAGYVVKSCILWFVGILCI